MAAGEGKRMNSNIPKVLHNFHGIPMLIRILLEVNKINPQKIIIITGKYDLLIKKIIKDYYDSNMNLINIYNTLIFIQQLEPNGTGGAIKCTLEQYSENEDVLILNGDMPLISSRLIQNFIKEKSNAKLLVSQLDNPYGYGRILYDENNKFIGIKEQKDCNEEEKLINIVNVGIYLFNSNILKKYIPLIDNNNVQNEYYLTDIVKIIRNNSAAPNRACFKCGAAGLTEGCWSLRKTPDEEINTYSVDEELKYQINGINTKEELALLEEQYKI
jgi:bifunctional N-acetylglucosamine-1-phosphate-uridyltransferase/glucosamine-1-phosphate-acetyltransferase GlmU-like protein